jgi:hypothetical protein
MIDVVGAQNSKPLKLSSSTLWAERPNPKHGKPPRHMASLSVTALPSTRKDFIIKPFDYIKIQKWELLGVKPAKTACLRGPSASKGTPSIPVPLGRGSSINMT